MGRLHAADNTTADRWCRKVDPRCAYAGCQAGGVILPGAPKVEHTDMSGKSWRFKKYHPGCWAAQQHWLDDLCQEDTEVPL